MRPPRAADSAARSTEEEEAQASAVVAAPAPDAEPTTPFEPAPDLIIDWRQRARALTLAAERILG